MKMSISALRNLHENVSLKSWPGVAGFATNSSSNITILYLTP